MDPGFQVKKENPREKASFLSKLFFTWAIDILRKSNKKILKIQELYKVLDDARSDDLGDILEYNWKKEIESAQKALRKPSLMRILIKKFGLNSLVCGMLMLTEMMLRAVQPLVLAHLIRAFARGVEDNIEMYIYGALIVALPFGVSLFQHHLGYRSALLGMKVRVGVSSLVYRKIIKLSQMSLSQTSTGQVINLLSNDVGRYEGAFYFLHAFWVVPIVGGFVSYFLWTQVEISCLAGIIPMVFLTLPLQGYLGKLTGNLRNRVAKKTDSRVKLMTQIITGIQVIKMYTWEKPFEKLVREMRDAELSEISKAACYRGFLTSWLQFLSSISLFLTLACYVSLGYEVTAEKIFSAAQCFSILQLGFALYLPLGILYTSEGIAATHRLGKFLRMKERYVMRKSNVHEGGVQIRGVSATWPSSQARTLHDISLQITPGSLCAIVGSVGSGKSSLLQLLLGELAPSNGQLFLSEEISYASQEPWLFGASIRNNILFGEPYNKSWYRKVVKVCALENDFEQLPDGDKSIVGDRGVLLSGGQKVRINLARAVYRDAEIYLLDDPLSAVDTKVGKYIFNECICNFLSNKTRVLVTHQLQYLKRADVVVIMAKGEIKATGSFDELMKSSIDFSEILPSSNEMTEEPKEKMVEIELVETRRMSALSNTFTETLLRSQTWSIESDIGEETTGDPNRSAFSEYIRSAKNMRMVAIFVLVLTLSQISSSSGDFWVAFWATEEEKKRMEMSNKDDRKGNDTNNGTNETFLTSDLALYVYATLISSTILLTIVRTLVLVKLTMMASKNLHSKMFHCLLLSPLQFFNSTPCGRIINRFSKDVGAIDEMLPTMLLETVQLGLAFLGIIVIIGISNPYTIASVLVCGVLFWRLIPMLISSAKNFKTLETMAKSPVFSHVGSTLNGIPTIRSTHSEKLLIKEFDHHQDVHSSAFYLTIACGVSFGLWIDMISILFVFGITFSFILLRHFTAVYGSLIGLALTQILGLIDPIQFGIRQMSQLIIQLTSVERVLQYTTLPTEGPFETSKGNLPDRYWPNRGKIEYRNVFLKYKDYSTVLKDISFTIDDGEKVGIVGRTGAGKSSLITTLFRLANIEGSILIDDVDTRTLGLTDLRKKISIIPQDPLLFEGTLRHNLDPFREFYDTSLWKVLEEVELKNSFPSLEYLITEGGSNFSVGERQLICLARAILRNNRILVLDEATANIDLRTDSFIQNTIRERFKYCTVLTIAHRLNTIMDSDKVLVMNAGENVEFDHPYVLLQKKDGYFSKLMNETGPIISQQLRDIARDSYQAKELDLYDIDFL